MSRYGELLKLREELKENLEWHRNEIARLNDTYGDIVDELDRVEVQLDEIEAR